MTAHTVRSGMLPHSGRAAALLSAVGAASLAGIAFCARDALTSAGGSVLLAAAVAMLVFGATALLLSKRASYSVEAGGELVVRRPIGRTIRLPIDQLTLVEVQPDRFLRWTWMNLLLTRRGSPTTPVLLYMVAAPADLCRAIRDVASLRGSRVTIIGWADRPDKSMPPVF